MRLASLLLCASLSAPCGLAAAATLNAPVTDAATLDTPFTLQRDTQVPGKVLKPGGYTLVIKDHLTDRAIIQVKKDDGKVESTFLGVFHSGMQNNGTGPISIDIEKGPQALRGFKFPGGGTIEFVYPKAEAAKLATKTPDQVLAIDPASDNLHTTGKDLSDEDAKIVTLWSLQATKVTTGQPGISAKKYVSTEPQRSDATVATTQAPPPPPAPAPAAVPPPPQASARVAVPRPVPAAQRPVPAPQSVAQSPAPAPQPVAQRPAPAPSTQVASAHRRPQIAALPHTASNLPVALLAAVLSFAAALSMRFRRLRQGR